jgi:hypothetical protein
MTNKVYQQNYFAANKVTIMAKRNLRRAAMTEAERETERRKARERAARNREKTRELISAVKELTAVILTSERKSAHDAPYRSNDQ